MLHIDIAEGFGDQRPGPTAVTIRRPQVENPQNAPRRLGRVFGCTAAIARFIETGQPPLGVSHPPLRRGARRAARLSPYCPRRHALGRKKHNPCPLAQTMLRLPRAHQAFQLRALGVRQNNRGRFMDAFHRKLES